MKLKTLCRVICNWSSRCNLQLLFTDQQRARETNQSREFLLDPTQCSQTTSSKTLCLWTLKWCKTSPQPKLKVETPLNQNWGRKWKKSKTWRFQTTTAIQTSQTVVKQPRTTRTVRSTETKQGLWLVSRRSRVPPKFQSRSAATSCRTQICLTSCWRKDPQARCNLQKPTNTAIKLTCKICSRHRATSRTMKTSTAQMSNPIFTKRKGNCLKKLSLKTKLKPTNTTLVITSIQEWAQTQSKWCRRSRWPRCMAPN